ncbi:alpha/beta-hydrolase [Gonapodya prolifera JEL478]|uniref:Alpha/beta-hydrolase n=1 Tax=Gonapodya prolifera (strain JEL478) TaxID=1344416 RepID=A0A139AD30_GONPJ|nr:alpha/beta-hydrolase [Gonapodya prolifera JEL478]|eukprot:KXS14323.1 alpha/beta-hydrolase [Gonapodya prolifera JEL478]
MSSIPILGRWSLNTYFRVGIYFALLLVEQVVRFLVSYTPLALLVWISNAFVGWIFSRQSRRQNDGQGPNGKLSDDDIHFQSLMKCRNVEDFANYWGYPLETHLAITQDVLALHRIPGPRVRILVKFPTVSNPLSICSTKEEPRSAGLIPSPDGTPVREANLDESWNFFAQHKPSPQKPVVLLWHGFMMCSEVWICHPSRDRSLAFTLADLGYDVWIANSRGNKYSCKHVSKKPSELSFWDFSMDEIVQFDVPATVDHILKVTKAEKLSYVGFSQGTAQAFASLSLNPTLNSKVHVFCALAPAAQPEGLSASVVSNFITASPDVIFLLLGRKRALAMAAFWAEIIPRPIWVEILNVSMQYLFSWTLQWIDWREKLIYYSHLYSYTSVKTVVHWFQASSRRFE